MTPLHYACKNGYIEAARILIENGADVNAVTPTISIYFIKCIPYRGTKKISFNLCLNWIIYDILFYTTFY